MTHIESCSFNPTSALDCTFEGYMARVKQRDAERMDGNGIPNYAFALDYEIRKKLDSFPNFYNIAKTMTSTYVAQETHELVRNSLAVGPNQFPEIYEIARDCARTLGISIPSIFITNSTEVNAYTVACDDVQPVINIYNGLRIRMTPAELKFIIGHECGHIQNVHGCYSYMVQLLASIGSGVTSGISAKLANIFSYGVSMALNTWSRASEVTADRAGMICTDSLEDCFSAMAKLMYGGTIGEQESIDINSIMNQLDETNESIAKYDEVFSTHPSTARRIKALKEFSECELYYQWRAEQKKAGLIMRSKIETDERCKRYIDLAKKG